MLICKVPGVDILNLIIKILDSYTRYNYCTHLKHSYTYKLKKKNIIRIRFTKVLIKNLTLS